MLITIRTIKPVVKHLTSLAVTSPPRISFKRMDISGLLGHFEEQILKPSDNTNCPFHNTPHQTLRKSRLHRCTSTLHHSGPIVAIDHPLGTSIHGKFKGPTFLKEMPPSPRKEGPG